ncbi:hypothetical protein MAPG_02488 [Magnaporthiopsis poae ATCC 64411]|uniref:Uncharacterized protein n=1 Tax=Magnaporthiopsis poae (strain ATCC 64411 / 73-15) TaxID=644358 RepID=A0A0C4DRI0_MAGP6|nr:hypothetical protein MAPG_02488 [Magnaporthiopsis poae ATCC 64411]
MRAAFSPSVALLLLLGAGSAAAAPQPQNPSLAQFEERFVNSLPYGDGGATTKFTLPELSRPLDLEPWYLECIPWYDRTKREIRIYFPAEGALLARGAGADFVEADAMGQVQGINEVLKRELDGEKGMAVLGRRVSEQGAGVEGNKIRDGVIYLAEPALPVRSFSDGRTAIYDFGIKSLRHDDHGQDDHHGHGKREDDGKKGCLQNHNGINCSLAYRISNGRCPMNAKTCMDYNGFKTDCKKGTTTKFGIPTLSKAIKFLGSDCSVSMARGHCWNEVM